MPGIRTEPANHEKLAQATALKRTTSISIGWLAPALGNGNPGQDQLALASLPPSAAARIAPKFKNVLSGFLA